MFYTTFTVVIGCAGILNKDSLPLAGIGYSPALRLYINGKVRGGVLNLLPNRFALGQFRMLKEKLQKELNEALKASDQLRRSVLGMLMTAIKNREVTKRTQLSKAISDIAELEKQSQLTDDEVLEVIASEVKRCKEAIEQFKTGGREELAQKEKSEMDILAAYLPEQASEKEIRAEVQKTIAELNAQGLKDMGRVIGAVMAKLKGKAEGGIVSKIAKELLQP